MSVKGSAADADSLQTRLSRFLMVYRNTPHPATGKSPASMLMGRKLRSRLDLLQQSPQTDQLLTPNRSASTRVFTVGERVLARDFRPGKSWQLGVVQEKIGHLRYRVRSGDFLLKRHLDQLLPCKAPTLIETPSVDDSDLEDTFVEEQAEDVPEDVELPAVANAPELFQVPHELPAREAVVEVAPAEPRRSGRIRRPPAYLRDFVISHVWDLFD